MELCNQDVKTKKKYDEKETAEMIKVSAVRASERRRQIEHWGAKSQVSKDPILKEFNIDVDMTKMTQLEGRVIPAPDIQYSSSNKPVPVVSSQTIGEKGSWDHRNLLFISPKEINNWVLINLDKRTSDKTVDKFIDTFIAGSFKQLNVTDICVILKILIKKF